MDSKRLVRVSKYLSLHLRHEPEGLGLELQPGGWVEVETLLDACRRHNFPLTRAELTVTLDHDLKPDRVRPEYQRATVRAVHGELRATTTGAQTSSRLLSMVGANALLKIEPGTEPLPAGTRVPALLVGELRQG